MLLLPYGLNDMRVQRVPPVSVGIAGLCMLLFSLTVVMGEAAFTTFGLTPANGVAQIGWLSSLFVHADVFHLLGNLLFFYIAGPVIEDAWGTTRFVLLYVLGGLAAGATEFFVAPESMLPIVGASGAIAACIGATCVQFPKRHVRVFYWFWIRMGTFLMPVWLWGGLWFLLEVYNFTMAGPNAGVAFGAHVGGFVFGAVFGLVIIKVQGDPFEAKYGAPEDPTNLHVPVVARAKLNADRDAAAQASLEVPEPKPAPAPAVSAPARPPTPKPEPKPEPKPVVSGKPRAFPKRPT